VVPGALRFAEEGDVLGLTAPRGLMVVSATRDAPQFSVAEAEKSLARAGPSSGCTAGRDTSGTPSSNRTTTTTARCARRCTAGWPST
jgi:hypothetical protein